MNLSILVDPVNEKCCLVDDDSGRAFGPVFTGEDCLAEADLFVTLAGEQLNSYEPAIWSVTLRAVKAMLSAEGTTPDTPVPFAAPAGVAAEPDTTGGPTPATSPEIAPEVPAAPADTDRGDVEPVPIGAAPAEPITVGEAPAGAIATEGEPPIPLGTERCWQCHGSGKVDGEPCDICDGAGHFARAGA